MSSSARTIAPLAGISPVAGRVIGVLAEYTAFPQALLGSVCERQGLEVGALTVAEAAALIHTIALQVALFNDVDAGFAVKRQLMLVLREPRRARR